MQLKKRPVALLEILIALTLIILCAIPLIRQPLANHRAEMAQLERIEANRIAASTFAELREAFLKSEIRWEQIPPLKETSRSVSLSDAQVQLPPFPSKAVKRSYTLETIEEKQEKEGTTYRLVSVHVKVGRNQFTYRLTLFKDGLPPKPEVLATENPTD